VTKLRIGIIGTGYVGLVTGVCFGELGFPILCGDVIQEKVDKINKGESPIFENGLESLLKELLDKKRIRATLNTAEVVQNSDVVFICTGTPSSDDGSIDLQYIQSAANDIGEVLKVTEEYKVIVVKSTVIPGTTSNFVKPILEKSSNKKAGVDFGLGMNPEFLKEGIAIKDFRKPDRIVIGCEDQKSYDTVAQLYNTFSCPIMKVDPSTAEMIKYASNSFLAVKISFINEIANMSEKMGVDISSVAEGMGLDTRISNEFLRPGLGFGGSCFPKDVKALSTAAKAENSTAKSLDAAIEVNNDQPLRAVQALESQIDIKEKRITLLGLAFKPETDDMREAPSVKIAHELISKGAIVIGYDPAATETANIAMPKEAIIKSSAEDALTGSDACILVTEWAEFENFGATQFSLMQGKTVIDGRRVLDWESISEAGFDVIVLGNPSIRS
jgi:UDPglucose 6-dehydrogenase